MPAQHPIVEMRRYGAAVKVTAIDPESLIEVSFQAPAATPQTTLHQLALAKLARAIARAKAGAPARIPARA